jgi:hypothetical protein
VSLYQLQQCVYDYPRTLEAVEAGSPVPELSTGRYDLSEEEEEHALKTGDVGAMYSMGIHPVIINGYCRAMGYRRAVALAGAKRGHEWINGMGVVTYDPDPVGASA